MSLAEKTVQLEDQTRVVNILQQKEAEL
jgi:ABC-type uncharacterized transport system substrate-binding protein